MMESYRCNRDSKTKALCEWWWAAHRHPRQPRRVARTPPTSAEKVKARLPLLQRHLLWRLALHPDGQSLGRKDSLQRKKSDTLG